MTLSFFLLTNMLYYRGRIKENKRVANTDAKKNKRAVEIAVEQVADGFASNRGIVIYPYTALHFKKVPTRED